MGKPVVHMNPSQAEETPLRDSFLNNSASVSSDCRSRLSSNRSTSSSRSPHDLSQALSSSSLLRKKKNRNGSMQTTMMHTNSAMGIEMKQRSISSGSRSRSLASSSGSPSVCSFVHSNASTTTESAGNISPKSSHNIRTAWTGTEEDTDRDIAAATATTPSSFSLLPSSFALLPPSSTKESTTTTTPSSFAVLPPSSIITTTTRIQSGCTSTCSIPVVCKTKEIVEVMKNNNLVLEENAYYGKNVHIDVDERIEITRQRTTASNRSSAASAASSTRSGLSDDIEQEQQQHEQHQAEEQQEQDQQSLLMPSKKTKSKKTKFLGFSLSSMKKKLSSSSSNKKNNKMIQAKGKAEAEAEAKVEAEELASQSHSPNDTTMDTTMDITNDSISSSVVGDDCQDSPSVVTGYTDFEGDAFFSTRDGAIVSISNITEEQEEEEKEEQEKEQEEQEKVQEEVQEEEEEDIRVSAARAEAAAEAGADTYVQFQTDDDQASVGTIVVVNEQQQQHHQQEEPHSEQEQQQGYAEDNGAFEVVLPFQSSRSNVLVSDFVPLTQQEQQRVREHYQQQQQQQQQQEQQQQQGVEQGHEQPSSMFFAAMEEHLLAKKDLSREETPIRRNRRKSHTSRRRLGGGCGVKHDTIEVLHQRSSESSNDELDELVFTISAASSSDHECCEKTIGTTTTTTSSSSKDESVDSTVGYGTAMAGSGMLSPSLIANRVRRIRSIDLKNTGIEIPRIISTPTAIIATTHTADDADVDSVAGVPLEEKETTDEDVVAADQQPTQSQEEEEEEEKEEVAARMTTTTLRRVTTAVQTEVKHDTYDDDAYAIEVEPSGTVQVVPQQRHQLSTTTVQQPYQLLRVVEDPSMNAVEVLRSRTMHSKLSTSCAKVVVPPLSAPSPSPSPSPIVTTTSTTEREQTPVAALTTAVLGPRIRSCSSSSSRLPSQSQSRSSSRRPRDIRMVNEENDTNIELFRSRTAATATTTTTDTATTDIATTDSATISFDENEEDVIVQRIIAMAPEQEEEVHIVGVVDDTIEVIAVTSTSTSTKAENNTAAASTTTLSNVEASSVSSMVDFSKMIKEKVERQDVIVDTTIPPTSPTMVLPSSSSEVVAPVTAPTTASSAAVSSVSPSGIRWDTTSSRRKETTKVHSSFEEYKKVEGERVSKVAVTAFDRAAVVKSIQKEDGAENDSALILLSQQTKQPQDEAMMSNTNTNTTVATTTTTTTTTTKVVKIEPATATTPKNDDPRRHDRSTTSATSKGTATATATVTVTATPQLLFQRESSFLSKRKMVKKAATSLVPRLAAPKKDTVKVHHPTTSAAAAGTIPRTPNSLSSKSRKLSYLRGGVNNKNSAATATATATIHNEEEEQQPKQVKIQVHSVKDTRNIKTIEVSPNTTTSSSSSSAIVGGDTSKPSTSLAATTKSLISSLAKKKKKYPSTTPTITDNKNEVGVAVVTSSEKSSSPITATAADTDDVVFPTVKHIVHVNVLGVAGIVVDRKSCKDVTGNQLSPGPPEQMKAVVGFKFLSTMDNVTSFSSTLIYSPSTKPVRVNSSSSGASVASSSSMQRHIAVWTSNHLGETPGSIIESKVLETEQVDQQDPQSKYLPKFLDLNVALAKNSQADDHVATVIGSATIKISDAMMRGGTSGENIIMDLPVHQFEREGLSSSLNNRVINLQATTKRKGTRKLFVKQPDHCNNDIMNNKENLMSAYSIDPSGDSMIRVQVRVEQLPVDEEEKELYQQVEMERIGSGTIGTEQSEGTSLSSGSRTASILPPAAAVCRVFDAFVPTRKSKKKKIPTGGPSGDELYSKSLEMPSRTTVLDDDDTGTFHTVSWKGKLLARNHVNGNNAGGGEESGCKIFGKNVPMPSCSAESRMAVAKKIDDKIEDIADHVFEKVGNCPTQDGNDDFFCEDSSQNLDRSDTYDTYRTNFTGITGPTLFTTRTKEDNEDKEEQPITPQILFQEMKDFLGPVPTMDEVKKLAREIAETSGEYFFPEDPKVVANEENDENSSVGSATLQAFESGQLRMRSTDSRLLAKMNNRFPRHDDGRNTTTTNNNNNNNSSSEEHFDTNDDLTYSTAGTFTSEPTLALNQPFGQEVEKKCSNRKDMPTENNNNEETGTIESYPTALEDVGCEGDDEDEESTLVEERTALVDGDEEDHDDDDIINTKGRLPLEAEEDKPSLPSIVVGNIAEALSLGKACSYFGSKNHDQHHPGLVSPTMAWGGEGKSVPRTVEPSDILSVGELTAITLEKNEIRKRNRKLLLSRLSMPLRCTEVDVALDDDGNTIVGPNHSMLTFDDELDDTSVVEGGGGVRRRKVQRRQPRENYFAEYEKDRTTSIDCPPQINNNNVVDNVLSNEKEIQTTTGSAGTSTTLISPPPPPPPPPLSPPPLSPPPTKSATTKNPTTATKASSETTASTSGGEETTDRIKTTTHNNVNVAESLRTDEQHDLLLRIIEEGDENEEEDGDTDCC